MPNAGMTSEGLLLLLFKFDHLTHLFQMALGNK